MATKLIIAGVVLVLIIGLVMVQRSRRNAEMQLQMAQMQAANQQQQMGGFGGQYGGIVSSIFGLGTAAVNAYSTNQANKNKPATT